MNFWALMAIPAFNIIPYGADFRLQLKIFFFIQLIFGTNVLWFGCRDRGFRTVAKILGVCGVIGYFVGITDIDAPVALTLSTGYFLGLVWVTFRRAIHYVDHTKEALMATISGFILIALTGFFSFQIIENIYPGSFVNLVTNNPAHIDDLFYYAFVTIMTIGYGDVVAVSWPARNAMILMALTGYLYSLIFIARMVSNYQNTAKKKQ